MWLIIALIVIAALLLVVELVLIPGISAAGVAAVVAAAAAVWLAFARYGGSGGAIAVGAVLLLSAAAAVIALRSKTWERLSLRERIDSTAGTSPEEMRVAVGDRGVALTRLAPMGKVRLSGGTFEAKSIDAYVDENAEVEVTGFENSSVTVRRLNQT